MIIKPLILFIFVLQICCSYSDKTNTSNISRDQSNVSNKPALISAETAVLIAQDYLSKNRDMQEFQPSVETENQLFKDYGEMWRVTFRSNINDSSVKPDIPTVWVFKSDGKIFSRDQIK